MHPRAPLAPADGFVLDPPSTGATSSPRQRRGEGEDDGHGAAPGGPPDADEATGATKRAGPSTSEAPAPVPRGQTRQSPVRKLTVEMSMALERDAGRCSPTRRVMTVRRVVTGLREGAPPSGRVLAQPRSSAPGRSCPGGRPARRSATSSVASWRGDVTRALPDLRRAIGAAGGDLPALAGAASAAAARRPPARAPPACFCRTSRSAPRAVAPLFGRGELLPSRRAASSVSASDSSARLGPGQRVRACGASNARRSSASAASSAPLAAMACSARRSADAAWPAAPRSGRAAVQVVQDDD